MAVVPAVGAASLGRDHDRPRTSLAELRLVAALAELVVVGAERVEQQGQAVAVPRSGTPGDVDRIGLEPPAELALAVVGAAAGGRVVGALLGLEVAGEDPVHRAGARHAAGLAVQVVRDPGLELAEVDPGKEGGEVVAGERVALLAVAPPRRVAEHGVRRERVLPGLAEAEGGVEEGRRDWRGRRRRRGESRSAASPGARYRPAALFQSPTPAARRTGRLPGSQTRCETRTWIWRRRASIDTCGAGLITFESLARTSSPCRPWTVRKSAAGARTLAPWGKFRGWAEPPIAIVVATEAGSLSVLRVIRKAVAFASGFTRSSTRSAALLAYTGLVG